MQSKRKDILAALGLIALVRCSAGGGNAALPVATHDPMTAAVPVGEYIQHVVIIVQENRSFNNLFAGFKGAAARTYGWTHKRRKIALRSISLVGRDLVHGWNMAHIDWDHGKMDGFDETPVHKFYPYSYVRHDQVAPYWTMARRYVLADHMFPTMFGPSFTAHLDLIAGTANLSRDTSEINFPSAEPWGCDASPGTTTVVTDPQLAVTSGPFPCFTQIHTMADTLDAAHVSWKYYAPPLSIRLAGGPIWSIFDAIQNVRYGPDWINDVISPQTTVLTDITSGNLAAVSWVIPDWTDSDHPGSGSNTGPSWVTSIVNAIGESQYWNSTAIVVVWDDWGGWYDQVPPPQLNFVGLGIRVPCIIVSPYAKAHYVSHTQYEFGSILKFVEQTFNLPRLGPKSLGYTDGRANSLIDSFDFTQAPRVFQPIAAPYPPSHFLTERPSLVPPDSE